MKKILFSLMALVSSMSMNAQIKGTVKRTGDIDVNWVQLWADGPKFAEYNVGAANNKAEDYGGYYCWGSSINKEPSESYKEGTDALTGFDDTATNLWGDNWRMPTQEEFEALIANCTVEWTDSYKESGIQGRIFTGKNDFEGNSMFLPAVGYFHNGNAYSQFSGYYWTSTPKFSNSAYCMGFSSAGQDVYFDRRYNGCSVRAVLSDNMTAIEGIIDNAINNERGGNKVIKDGKLIVIGNNGKIYNAVGAEICK